MVPGSRLVGLASNNHILQADEPAFADVHRRGASVSSPNRHAADHQPAPSCGHRGLVGQCRVGLRMRRRCASGAGPGARCQWLGYLMAHALPRDERRAWDRPARTSAWSYGKIGSSVPCTMSAGTATAASSSTCDGAKNTAIACALFGLVPRALSSAARSR